MTHSGAGLSIDPSSLDYAIDIEHPSAHANGDIGYGNVQPNGDYRKMTFYRDKSPNGFPPTLHQEPDGQPSLKLAVAKDAYLDATDGDYERCDRCELRDPKLLLGTPVWYSFEIRADQDFPIIDARCVCAQIKAPYYDEDNGSPLFALRIDRGRYLATVEHMYEIKDTQLIDGSEVSTHVTRYSGAGSIGAKVRALDHHVFGNTARDFKELQVRAILAVNSRPLPAHIEDAFRWCSDLVKVTPGKPLPDDIYSWQRFTIQVAPTNVKDEDGVLRLLWFNPDSGEDEIVATAVGEFGHTGYPDPDNDGPLPGTGRQYFKIGPYRDKIRIWGCRPAAIYVRNIKRGFWEEGVRLRAALRA
jgi:hypothetical protein